MLLPALSKARDKARAITCTNNLKQLGNFLVFYADDNDSYMVPCLDKGKLYLGSVQYYSSGTWYAALAEQYCGMNIAPGNYPSNANALARQLAIFFCPSTAKLSANTMLKTYYEFCNYAYNSAFFFGGDGSSTTSLGIGAYMNSSTYVWINKCFRMGSFKNPAGTYAIGDAMADINIGSWWEATRYMLTNGASNQVPTCGTRHAGKANVLFTDMHVETQSRGEITGEKLYMFLKDLPK